jgi:hypothetical protein
VGKTPEEIQMKVYMVATRVGIPRYGRIFASKEIAKSYRRLPNDIVEEFTVTNTAKVTKAQ